MDFETLSIQTKTPSVKHHFTNVKTAVADTKTLETETTHAMTSSREVGPPQPNALDKWLSKQPAKAKKSQKKESTARKRTKPNPPAQTLLRPVHESIQLLDQTITKLIAPSAISPKAMPVRKPLKFEIRDLGEQTNDQEDYEMCRRIPTTLWNRAGCLYTPDPSASKTASQSLHTLENAIESIRKQTEARIHAASLELAQQIMELKEEHRCWIEKEKEQCESLIQEMMNNPFMNNDSHSDPPENQWDESLDFKQVCGSQDLVVQSSRKTCIFDISSSSSGDSDVELLDLCSDTLL